MKNRDFSLQNYMLLPDELNQQPAVYVPKGEAFRLHPDSNRHAENVLILLKDRRWHLVDAGVVRANPRIPGLWHASLYEGVLKSGHTFFLPITYPRGEGYESWYESIMEIVPKAQKHWVIVESDSNNMCYRARIEKLSERPQWKKRSFESLIAEAFEDHMIDANSHHLRDLNLAKSCRRTVTVVEEF